MDKYEFQAVIDGWKEVAHDVELDMKENITDFIEMFIKLYYKTHSYKIYTIKKYEWEVCGECNGTGVVEPCCKGAPRFIECGCEGKRLLCNCENGYEKKYTVQLLPAITTS